MENGRRLTNVNITKYFVVIRSTILKKIKSERLSAYLYPHGQYHIPQAAFVVFLKEHNMPIDKGLLSREL